MPVVSTPPFLALPEGVIRHTVRVEDVDVATLQTSGQETGARVLLAPGFSGSKEDFLGLLPLLAGSGVHAVSYDHPGQHESRSLAGAQRFSIERLAQDMRTLSQRVWPSGPRPHLVGHSLGGLVARRAVLSDPEAFTSLTLVASGPHKVPAEQQEALDLLRALIPQTDLATIWQLKAARDRELGLLPEDPVMLTFLQQRWEASNPEALAAKASILTEEPDRVGELRATGVPVHVVTGSADDVWSPEVQAQMAQRLDARHTLIEGCGHAPASDDPAATARTMAAFWASLH